MKLSDDRVVLIFNEMRDDYDDLRDLWYAWLFCRLHYFIVKDIICRWNDPTSQRVLDVGCGSGFQTFLYASLGCQVAGIDIANALVDDARRKLTARCHIQPDDLFPSYFPFVDRYNRKIRQLLDARFPERHFEPPVFEVGSALQLPYQDGEFTHVNCCGSVLSFIADHTVALNEIERVLRPGGTYILEVEAKYNFDLLWPLLDSTLFRGRLGFDCRLKEAIGMLAAPPRAHVFMEYPFGEVKDPVHMNIKLFSRWGLRDDLCARGLIPEKWRSIHSVTNLIPSILLDTIQPGRILQRLFFALARVEELVPLALPGCSLVVLGRKRIGNVPS
jgi:ubiquinone/menaquinone biosynthesis C-methylase UbiE